MDKEKVTAVVWTKGGPKFYRVNPKKYRIDWTSEGPKYR